MNELKRTAIKNMAQDLLGTCQNAESYQIEHGLFPLTDEEQDFFDTLAYQCPECEYWIRPCDEIDGMCQDCYDEMMEEEAREEEEEDDE